MLSDKTAFECAEKLSTLKYFPGAHALPHVAAQLQRFIPTEEHAERTINYVLDHSTEWPSIVGLREAARNFGQLRDEDSHGRPLKVGTPEYAASQAQTRGERAALR